MSGRTRVLGDHKRVKSKLITPFNDLLGPTRDVSWINTMMPELLWIALLHDAHGDRCAVEIVTRFTRAARAYASAFSNTVFAAAGKFSEFPEGALPTIMAGLDIDCANAMRTALAPLAAWYPAHPLNAIHALPTPDPDRAMLEYLRRVVSRMYARSDRATMMPQATAIWLAFDSGRFKVSPDISLADFPKIEEYPMTELSQRIGASIRASLNQMFGEGQMMASDGRWPVAFWNHGLHLQACEFGDD